ncbi:hypothetical protein [Rhodococcus erythropolis]
MVASDPTEISGVVRPGELKPYCVIIVLSCDKGDAESAFRILRRFLERSLGEQKRAVAVRLTGRFSIGAEPENANLQTPLRDGIDEVVGFVRERITRPSWASADSDYQDVTNELGIALRRDRLVAVLTPERSALLKWVDSGISPYRRLPISVLESAFQGDGKSIWLSGAHRRRATKADSKNLTGIRLQDALNPIDDSSYVLNAVRLHYESDSAGSPISGNIVVSSAKSQISIKAMPDFDSFTGAAEEVLIVLEKALAREAESVSLFPELASREIDLGRVWGAFDILVSSPIDLSHELNSSDDLMEHAAFLETCLLQVSGDLGSADAIVEVGINGSVCGELKITPVSLRTNFTLDVRLSGSPTDHVTVERIKHAIGNGELITIYYESGHAFCAGQLSRQNAKTSPFHGYEFDDFSGFDIVKEKPTVRGDQAIHDAIGGSGDKSIFSWIVEKYSKGWLICDDGSGEVADFLHIDEDGTLNVIHVKAAKSAEVNRRIAVAAYEVVTAQAKKNILQYHKENLLPKLMSQRISNPACWTGGKRTSGRGEFIEMLDARVNSDRTNVVIVQPHLLRSVYELGRSAQQNGRPDQFSRGLDLLDNLLHTTKSAVTAVWDELIVIGAL